MLMSILHFHKKKRAKEKITMLTCYDATMASLLDKTAVDSLLVGDSVAMVMHGFDNTISATMDMMVLHTQSVARGSHNKLIIADMPFLSYGCSIEQGMKNAATLMQAGAHAIKLEGAENLKLVERLVNNGIPVIGHLGLTPQSVNQLGGHRIQGRDETSADKILNDAQALEKAGCFSIVLECVPSQLAKQITEALSIATIGIGAGNDCDGQVLVAHDMLGLNLGFEPKFLKHYADLGTQLIDAVNRYTQEVKDKSFPEASKHTYQGTR